MDDTLIGFGIGLDVQTDSVVESTCRKAGLTWVRHSMLETLTLRDDLASAAVVVASLPEQADTARLLIERLTRRHSPAGVIFLSERYEHRAVVEALRAGAEEVLQWPAEADRLEGTIVRLTELAQRKRARIVECRQAQEKLDQLSTGEREVLELMLDGKVNKLVASRLGIALRTVENRRKQIFTKLGTRGFAEIVRMVQDADRLLRFDLPQIPEMPWAAKLDRAS